MVRNLSEYLAETTKAYDGARNALQQQLAAVDTNLGASQKRINENYATQQANLEQNQRDAAANASLNAAANGTSFGGATAIANQKYYKNAFMPAQTQLTQSRQQSLDSAEQTAANNRLSLQSQLASLADQATKYAMQRRDADIEAERQAAEAEKNRRAQIEAARASAASYMGQQASTPTSTPDPFGHVGNDDYRGFLAYRAKIGDNTAKNLLAHVGNDGMLDNNLWSNSGLRSNAKSYYKGWLEHNGQYLGDDWYDRYFGGDV